MSKIAVQITDHDPHPVNDVPELEVQQDRETEAIVQAISALQAQWGDEQYHWVIQEQHHGMDAEQRVGTMAEIIDRVQEKYGAISHIENQYQGARFRWQLIMKKRGVFVQVNITAESRVDGSAVSPSRLGMSAA